MGRFASPETGDYFGINADILAGTAHIGRYLHLENPQVDANNNPTGVMQFKVDSTGAWLNNSTFVLQKDGGGKILLDPKYGIVAGTQDLFDTDGTTVLPSFIDKDGELVLDKLGMPEKANFFLDLRDGSAYFRGDGVYGKNLYAENFYFQDGSGDVKTLIDQAAKKADFSHLDYIDLGGITLDGRTGNINFSGAGSITWGNNIPNKKRFAASTSGPWHDSMQSGDIYCCDWNYALNQWGTPYKFVGTDGANGRPGSDANVPQWVKDMKATYIDNQWVIAPNIVGGNITALDKMEAACDFYVGDNIYLGKYKSGLKSIWFNGTANISSETQDCLSISCDMLDFSTISYINWGRNAPTAVFA